MQITGSTELLMIIGDPIQQVRAPEVFNRVFREAGVDAVLIPAWIQGRDVTGFVYSTFEMKNMRGMLVTIPHKVSVMGTLTSHDRLAGVAGAVNAVRRAENGTLDGAFFDGLGFVGGLDHYNIAYVGKRILIVGSGGSASAIAASLADSGAAHIALYDPVAGKAAELAGRIHDAFGVPVVAAASSDAAGFDLVVNATPLGMNPDDAMPFDIDRLESHAAVLDILMKNQPTPLVRAVRARGLQAEPGFEMLIQQTPYYLEFFGFAELARQVRTDASSLRRLIYPPELL